MKGAPSLYHTDSSEDSADYYCDRAFHLFDDDPLLALENLEAALVAEPCHLRALNLAGELYLFEYEALGRPQVEADEIALEYFERALAYEPRFAEAWSGKSMALFYQEEDEAALEAADQGLAVCPLRIGFGMSSDDFFTNIAELLHNIKVKTLVELGRSEEAREALAVGLAQCPGSALLTQRIVTFLPPCPQGPR